MQPAAVSEGSRCTCLSVFISCVLWLTEVGVVVVVVVVVQSSRLTEGKNPWNYVNINEKMTNRSFLPPTLSLKRDWESSFFTGFYCSYLWTHLSLWRDNLHSSSLYNQIHTFLISLQVSRIRPLTELAQGWEMCEGKGGNTPGAASPRNRANKAEGGIPFDWLDVGKAAWKPEIPPSKQWNYLFYFHRLQLSSPSPSVTQLWHSRFLPETQARFLSRKKKKMTGAYVPRNNSKIFRMRLPW